MKIDEAIARFHDYIATERRMATGTVENYIGDLHDLADYSPRTYFRPNKKLMAHERPAHSAGVLEPHD